MNKLFFVLFCTVITSGLMSQRLADITLPNETNNFKTAEPVGACEAHFIDRSKDITYTIHFQNIGSDTALNLRILDTLSAHLDASSLREEGASHPFNLTIINGNVVRFSFPNIRLPNNATDADNSSGFVSFTVSQKENLPLMTRIVNKASIYFDFRPAITTNLVHHTIFETTTSTNQVFLPNLSVGLSPNPVSDKAIFDIDGIPFQHGQLEVYDLNGKLVQVQHFQTPHFDFFPSQRSTGQFFYRITLDGQLAATGSFMAK